MKYSPQFLLISETKCTSIFSYIETAYFFTGSLEKQAEPFTWSTFPTQEGLIFLMLHPFRLLMQPYFLSMNVYLLSERCTNRTEEG